MLKPIVDFGSKLLTLVRRVDKLEDDSKNTHQQLKELSQKVDDLTDVVRQMAFEIQLDKETAKRDQEILRLRLENVLLRLGRGLPPADWKNEEEQTDE